jgi:anti-sigma B factor antagonist
VQVRPIEVLLVEDDEGDILMTRPWFEVGVERDDGQDVVVFRGDLDLDATDDLWRCIEQVRTSGRPVVVDFSEATFMDSSGVNLLLRAYAVQGRLPEAVTLRRPSDPVRRTLALTGIDGGFHIDDGP